MGVTVTRPVAAMLGSLLLHGLLAVVVAVYGTRLASEVAARSPEDVWAGDTFEISAFDESPTAGDEPPGDPRPREDEGAPPAAGSDDRPAAGPAAPSVPRGPRAEYPADEGMGVDDAQAPRRAEYPADEGMGVDDTVSAEDEPSRSSAPREEPDELVRRILEYSPKPTSAHAPATSPSSGGPRPAAAGPTAPAGRPGGPAEEATRPRSLPRAFARAIPAANTSDPAWRRLPLGAAGKLRFDVIIDDAGHIEGTDLGEDPPAHLERLVQRTVVALRGGRFELAGATIGRQHFELEVTISQRPVAEGPLELGFRTPRIGQPGAAYFQLSTGRRVDVTVTLLP